MKGLLLRSVAWCVMALTYGCVAALPRCPFRHRKGFTPTGRLLVTGTFYNRGWFLSHLKPLAGCGTREVICVTDVPQPPIAGVTVVCPSPRSVQWLGRTGAKLLLMWQAGRRYRPDVYMGYHLFPGAVSALVVARLMGRPAAYQMTGGPLELVGGGYGAENVVMSKLGGPSRSLEWLAVVVARRFDLIIVRGRQAQRFLAERGIVKNVSIITGSVPTGDEVALADRPIDMIFVGRLTTMKQPSHFVEIVARVARSHPGVRAVMIGGGPEQATLQQSAEALGIQQNIEFLGQQDNVFEYLSQSKVFVLTSRSEGMAIALIEAMACGVPAVVADVGELSDVVAPGVNGWLVGGNDLDEYAAHVSELLDDAGRWKSFSGAAREAATQLSSLENVGRRWRSCLEPFACLAEVAVV